MHWVNGLLGGGGGIDYAPSMRERECVCECMHAYIRVFVYTCASASSLVCACMNEFYYQFSIVDDLNIFFLHPL